MPPDRDACFTRLASLRVDVSSGNPAPHKPLLVLTLADMYEAGELDGPRVPLDARLTFRFTAYWPVVVDRRDACPVVRLPFHHLASDGVARRLAADFSVSRDRASTEFLHLDPAFHAILTDPQERRVLRQLIIQTYFGPDEQRLLFLMLGLHNVDGPADLDGVRAEAGVISPELRARTARFRVAVVAAYDYRCALTRRRLLTVDAATVVDAAHVRAFAAGGSNHVTNGLALSRDSHFLFDAGLWTLDDDLRVLVSPRFAEDWPGGQPLASLAEGVIHLPVDLSRHPSRDHVRWHRETVFRA